MHKSLPYLTMCDMYHSYLYRTNDRTSTTVNDGALTMAPLTTPRPMLCTRNRACTTSSMPRSVLPSRRRWHCNRPAGVRPETMAAEYDRRVNSAPNTGDSTTSHPPSPLDPPPNHSSSRPSPRSVDSPPHASTASRPTFTKSTHPIPRRRYRY